MNSLKVRLQVKKFLYRELFKSGIMALIIIIISLTIGAVGFHFTVDLSWIDSFFNASMILGGMGLIAPINNDSGKIFASFFAIYSGAAFLSSIAIFISPIIHRAFHKYHIDSKTED